MRFLPSIDCTTHFMRDNFYHLCFCESEVKTQNERHSQVQYVEMLMWSKL